MARPSGEKTKVWLEGYVYYTTDGNLRWRMTKGRCRQDEPVGWRATNGYVRGSVGGYETALHRLVWLYHTGHLPTKDIDHINGVRSDNRFENLRVADRSQNNMNYDKPSDNTSGRRGVYFRKKCGTWYWQIQYKGTVYSGSNFKTVEEANVERMNMAKSLVGEFAYEQQ